MAGSNEDKDKFRLKRIAGRLNAGRIRFAPRFIAALLIAWQAGSAAAHEAAHEAAHGAAHEAAHGAVVQEPGDDAYHYVSQHAILIDAPPATVWPVLERLGTWMYEFDMAPVAGEPGQAGEVYRLYAGQDFLVQVLHKVPNEQLVIANLPSMDRDEFSTGVGVLRLIERDGVTEVQLTMVRRFTWHGDGENPLIQTRRSASFQENTTALWRRFLNRLKTLSEEG